MGWQAIVAAIISVLGPLLKAWLESRLKDKAAALDATGSLPGGGVVASATLLKAVRGDLWFWELRRKRYVDKLLADVPAAVAGVRAIDRAAVAAVACD